MHALRSIALLSVALPPVRAPSAQQHAERSDDLRLTRFEMLASEDAAEHPIRKLYRVQGIQIPERVRTAPDASERIAEFCDRLRWANREYLELPATGGDFVLDELRVHDSAIAVTYHQEWGGWPVFDSTLRFVFNGEGWLGTVTVQSWLDVSAADVPRLSADRVRAAARPHLDRIRREQLGGEAKTVDASDEVVELREGIAVREGVARPGALAFVYVRGGTGALPYALLLAADTGELLEERPLWMGAGQQVGGTVSVIDPSDAQAPTPVSVRVGHLVGDATLQGIVARVLPTDPARYSQSFVNTTSSVALDQQTLYYYVTRSHLYVARMGASSLLRSFLWANQGMAGCGLTNGCYWSWPTSELWGGDVTASGAIALHEIGHAIQDDVGGWNNGFPFDYDSWSFSHSGSLCAGTADYHSSSFLNDRSGGTASADIDSTINNPPWPGNEDHAFGRVWGAALWDLRQRLGNGIADRLSIQSMYHSAQTATYQTYFETALVQADHDLYGGQHEDVLRRVFSIRGIFGAQPSYPWSSPFPFSQRVYPDNVDQTQSYSIPGATGLRVTFDAYTKTYAPVGYPPDLIYVMDGAGVDIAGSPFEKRELQNVTVTVPGDTVRIRLVSTASDNRYSAGYRVLNIAAVDPSNLPPVPALAPVETEGMEPLSVEFDLSGSYDPDGTVIACSIDPGDGSVPIHMDENVRHCVHIYHRDGIGPLLTAKTFQAVVTVTDNDGATTTISVPVHVRPYDPDEGITAFPPMPNPHVDALVGGEWRQRCTLAGPLQVGCAFGYFVSPAGDMNNDGTPDIVVGAPTRDVAVNGFDEGTAYVHSSSDGSYVGIVVWSNSDGWFAHSGVGVGDVNNDGLNDLAIGGPRCTQFGAPGGSGVVRICNMNAGQPMLIRGFAGLEELAELGWSVANCGDIDGDGEDDVIAGAPNSAPNNWSVPSYCSVFVYSAASGAQLFRFDGEAVRDRFGASVAAVNDVTGDGKSDFLVGAPYASPNSVRHAGSAYLYSSSNGALIRRIDGSDDVGLLGYSVASAGDSDGDGVADIAVGAPGRDVGGVLTGGVSVYSGSTGQHLWTVNGNRINAMLGRSVSGVGDVDRDGYPDLLCGAPGAMGGGYATLLSGRDGSELHRFGSSGSELGMGQGVCGLGDLNQDGVPELAIGHPNDAQVGKVYVWEFDPYLLATSTTISASAGGTIQYAVRFPTSEAGRAYIVLASATGRGPSVWHGARIPLKQDPLFQQMASGASPLPLTGAQGTLDAIGDATIVLDATSGALAPWVGQTLWLAVCSELSPTQVARSSAFVRLVVVP